MNSSIQTQDYQTTFQTIAEAIPDGGHRTLNFGNPKERHFLEAMLDISSVSAGQKSYFLGLAQQHPTGDATASPLATKADENSWQTAFQITGVGAYDDQTAAAQGFGTVVSGCGSMLLSLVVQDATSGAILAEGSAVSESPLATMFVNTQRTGAKPPTGRMVALLSYVYQVNQGSTSKLVSGVTKADADTSLALATTSVLAPVRNAINPINPAMVTTGLGLPWREQGTRYDYVWNETTRPVGKIPFVGQATFDKAIATPLIPGTNLEVSIQLINESLGGMASATTKDLETFYTNAMVSSDNPNQLRWNLPPGLSDLNPGNPIVFHNLPWPIDVMRMLVRIRVTFTDGSNGLITIQSMPGQNPDTPRGIQAIMPLNFNWH